MLIEILKSKLHRATVTAVHLDYEGSCAIDQSLLKSANIFEYEQIHIYNLNNGERFTTYAIKAEKDSGVISLNGAAAFKGKVNDKIIICSYVYLHKNEISTHKPRLVYFKDNSNVVENIKNNIKEQKKILKIKE